VFFILFVEMAITLEKLSNHDVAYHMGIMDTITIMFEQSTALTGESEALEYPKSFIGALDARRRYLTFHNQSKRAIDGPQDRDITKAATLAQRAVDDISNHSGSMPDTIVYTHDNNCWTWAPAYSIFITQRPLRIPSWRTFNEMSEAQHDADLFSESVRRISKWADSSIRRNIQSWAQRRQRIWTLSAKNNVTYSDLLPTGSVHNTTNLVPK